MSLFRVISSDANVHSANHWEGIPCRALYNHTTLPVHPTSYNAQPNAQTLPRAWASDTGAVQQPYMRDDDGYSAYRPMVPFLSLCAYPYR